MRKIVTRRDALTLTAGAFAAALVSASTDRANAAEQEVTLYILPGALKGPDGKGHDAFVPSSFVVKAGSPVQLRFMSYDDAAHSFTAPDLRLNITVKGGKQVGSKIQPAATTVSFVPAKAGTYRWYCALQCDGPSHWSMDQGYAGPSKEGYMAGFIVVM